MGGGGDGLWTCEREREGRLWRMRRGAYVRVRFWGGCERGDGPRMWRPEWEGPACTGRVRAMVRGRVCVHDEPYAATRVGGPKSTGRVCEGGRSNE